MGKYPELDWLECEEVEAVPGRCGGRPTIKGTRVRPEVIVANFEGGRKYRDVSSGLCKRHSVFLAPQAF